MVTHAPRPPELPADPQKALCGTRIDIPGPGLARMATQPSQVDCDTCTFRLLRYAQSERKTPSPTAWPWAPPSPHTGLEPMESP